MSLGEAPWWQPVAVEEVSSEMVQTRVEGSSNAAFWGVIGYAFVLLVAPQQLFTPLAHLRPAMLAVAFTVPVYVVAKLRAAQPIFCRSPSLTIVLWLVVWSLLMLPTSLWFGGSIRFLTDVFFKTLTLFLLLAHVIDSVEKLKKLLWLLVLVSVLVSVTTVDHFFHNVEPDLGTKVIDRVTGYVSPLTENPNDLALTLNLIVPVGISLLQITHRKSVRLLLAGVICLDIFSIVLSFSRGGFLTLCVIGIAYLWVLGRRAIVGVTPLILLCAFAIVPFVPSTYLERLDTITHYHKDPTGSAQERARDMGVAVDLALRHPIIGAGAGLDWLALNDSKTHSHDWLHVHDVYLELAVDLGFPGLCLYLMLVYQVFKAAGRAAKATGDLGRLATGIRVSLVGFVFAAVFYPCAYYYYFYVFAAMALAADAIHDRWRENDDDIAMSSTHG